MNDNQGWVSDSVISLYYVITYITDNTDYTEYCRNQQNETTIASATDNNQTNEDIDSNSGYEEYNERK